MEIKSIQFNISLRLTFCAAMLLAFTFISTNLKADPSIFISTETTNLITKDSLVEYGETLKMTAIPDEEVQNQAVLTFQAEHEEATFLVFNLNGILEKEELFYVANGEENTVKLDLSGMRSGTYYIVHDQSKAVAAFGLE